MELVIDTLVVIIDKCEDIRVPALVCKHWYAAYLQIPESRAWIGPNRAAHVTAKIYPKLWRGSVFDMVDAGNVDFVLKLLPVIRSRYCETALLTHCVSGGHMKLARILRSRAAGKMMTLTQLNKICAVGIPSVLIEIWPIRLLGNICIKNNIVRMYDCLSDYLKIARIFAKYISPMMCDKTFEYIISHKSLLCNRSISSQFYRLLDTKKYKQIIAAGGTVEFDGNIDFLRENLMETRKSAIVWLFNRCPTLTYHGLATRKNIARLIYNLDRDSFVHDFYEIPTAILVEIRDEIARDYGPQMEQTVISYPTYMLDSTTFISSIALCELEKHVREPVADIELFMKTHGKILVEESVRKPRRPRKRDNRPVDLMETGRWDLILNDDDLAKQARRI